MSQSPEHTLRAGTFDSVNAAKDAIHQLLDAGFTHDDISVICHDEARSQHFPEWAKEETSGGQADKAMDMAGAGMLGLGGAAVLATLLSGGGALFAIGAFSGLAAGGTFAALMATRGLGNEATDYYEQAVESGKLLVTVEAKGDDAQQRLDEAGRILNDAGAQSFELDEG